MVQWLQGVRPRTRADACRSGTSPLLTTKYEDGQLCSTKITLFNMKTRVLTASGWNEMSKQFRLIGERSPSISLQHQMLPLYPAQLHHLCSHTSLEQSQRSLQLHAWKSVAAT